MSRILLVDDSPHAQRMGERILSDEGYEVVTVSNADSALIRLADVDPDVVLADTVMPGRTGFEICQYLKMSPSHRHVRVILTAGVLEPLDEEQTRRVEADGTLKKPFEASALLAAVKPLAEAAAKDRAQGGAVAGAVGTGPAAQSTAPFLAVVDVEQVRAAVTVALDASMASMIDEISRRVLAALHSHKPEAAPEPTLVAAAPPSSPLLPPQLPNPAPPPAAAPGAPGRIETVRRVSPLRLRPGSILGIEVNRPERTDAVTENPPGPAAPRLGPDTPAR